MQLDLNRVVETVGKEKNIDKDMLIEAIKDAVLMAAKRHFGECNFEVRFDEEMDSVELIRYREVVPDKHLSNPNTQISLSQAKVMDESLEEGDEVGEQMPTEQLGRIAAQAAKQAIVQKVLEAERNRVLKDFKEKRSQVVVGQVKRFDKVDVIVDLGATEAVLPLREQITGEKFKIRDKVTAYLLDVKKSSRGPQVILSRVHPELLVRLFEQEVAEIADGIVVIQSAARDPGSRSKIAVYSNDPSVDPVGACVGIKGARVQTIVQELRGEKVDIIPFDRDPARFVCNALAPAEPSKVIVNERLHSMKVIVPDDHLSLAIGRRGQNVRLAVQLTGWKLDILSESKMREQMQERKALIAQIAAVGEIRAEILVNEGYHDPVDIARIEPKVLVRLLRLTDKEAEQVIQSASALATEMEQAEQRRQIEKQEEDEDLLSLQQLGLTGEALVSGSLEEAEIALADMVAKQRIVPDLDPDSIAVSSVPLDILDYWMQVRTVAEQTAAVLHAAGFTDYEQLVACDHPTLARRTGLPVRLVGRIHAETKKLISA